MLREYRQEGEVQHACCAGVVRGAHEARGIYRLYTTDGPQGCRPSPELGMMMTHRGMHSFLFALMLAGLLVSMRSTVAGAASTTTASAGTPGATSAGTASGGEQNVDALLKDLEGILSDVMGAEAAPSAATSAAGTPSTSPSVVKVAPAALAAPAAPAAPAADGSGEDAAMANEMGLGTAPTPVAAPAMAAGGGNAPPEQMAPSATTVPVAAASGGDAPAAKQSTVPVAAEADAIGDSAEDAVAAPMQSAKATDPVTIPDAGNVIEPFTPTVPPAVEVDAVPARTLSTAEAAKLMKEAMSWFVVGEYRQAVPKLIELLRADPKHAEARYYLAYSRYRMGDFPQARAEFHALYQVKSDFSPVKRNKRPMAANTDKGAAQPVLDVEGMSATEAEGTGTAAAVSPPTGPEVKPTADKAGA